MKTSSSVSSNKIATKNLYDNKNSALLLEQCDFLLMFIHKSSLTIFKSLIIKNQSSCCYSVCIINSIVIWYKRDQCLFLLIKTTLDCNITKIVIVYRPDYSQLDSNCLTISKVVCVCVCVCW